MSEKDINATIFEDACAATARTLSRDGKLKVIFGGVEAFTNGDIINLPALDPSKSLSAETATVVRGYVDHEAFHNRYSDMPELLKHMGEAVDKGDTFTSHLINGLEDLRIEREGMKDYPGSFFNISATADKVAENFLKDNDPSALSEWTRSGPFAITIAGRKLMGHSGPSLDKLYAAMPASTRTIAETYAKQVIEKCPGTSEIITLSKAIAKAKDDDEKKSMRPAPVAGGASSTSGGSGTGREAEDVEASVEAVTAGSSTSSGGGSTGSGSASSTGSGGGKPAEVKKTGHDRSADPVISPTLDINKLLAPVAAAKGRYTYVTTAFDREHYWKKPTTAVGRDMSSTDGFTRYANVRTQIGGPLGVMKRKLERALASRLNRAWIGGYEEGRLDNRRLVAAVSGKRQVYRQREDAPDIDTAVSIVVDLSGSMHGNKITVAEEVTIALCEALAPTGVVFEITGFSASSGIPKEHVPIYRKMLESIKSAGVPITRQEALDLYIFKGFNDRLSESRGAIGGIHRRGGGNNVDGESIMWAYRRLMKRPETKKIMMVLSDGCPACYTEDSRGLMRNLRDSVEYISTHGVSLVGIGIQDETVSRYYPRYQVITSVEELGGAVMDNIAKMILGERFQVDNTNLIKAGKLGS